MSRLLTGTAVLLALLAAGCAPTHTGGYDWTDTRVDHGPGMDEEGAWSRRAKLCISGDLSYATWTDDRDGKTRVYLNRSLDGGLSWEPADILVSADTPQDHNAANPSIACDGGRVVVVWEDDRDGEFENPGIYANMSTDGGITFAPDAVPLTADGYGDWRSLEPVTAMAGGMIYVAWTDGRHGGYDIYYNASLDLGETWLEEEIRLTTSVAGSSYSAYPRLATDGGGTVGVAWLDRRDELNDVYFNRSLEHGLPGTWLGDDLRVDTGDLPGFADSYAPDIDIYGPTAAIAWHDRRNSSEGMADIFVNVVIDLDEPSFYPAAKRVDTDAQGASNSLFPDVEILPNGSLGVVFRNERSGFSDIYFSRSDNKGIDWFATEIVLDSLDGAASHAMDPVLATGYDGNLAVAWPDLRDSSNSAPWEDMYVTTSADFGDSWLPEWRIDDGYAGSARSVYPQIAIRPGSPRVQVLWEDWRAGNPDIFFRSTPFEGLEGADE